MARSSTRAKPYVVEIQRHYYLDELDNRGKRGYRSRPPVATPKMTPRVHLNAPRSHEGEMSKARHVSMDPSRLKSGSLEYEDIYDRRDLSRGNSHFKPAGRWSLRDDGGYGRVHGNTRRSPGIARATEMRLMMNGDVRQQNGTVSDHGKMRASYKGGQIRTNEGPSHEQKRITRDKNDNQRDDLELWIARQTSFPKKQDEKAERTSNQRIPENDTVSHELKQSNSIHEKSRNVAPPTVFLKPPHPQTSRSASPAPSIRSNQSGASSHASHHSARSGTSEVSVVSITRHVLESQLRSFLVVQQGTLTVVSLALQQKDT